MLAERHKQKFLGQADRAVVSISIDQIAALGLEVKANPDRADPRHCLVVGIPDPSRGPDQLAAAERLAQKLASSARKYAFPET